AQVGLQNEVARLQSELRQTNEQLRRSRELAALGQMAAGIAHEIRNPLGCIRLYSALLRDDLEELPESKSIVERIDRAALDMDAIVGDVLAFAREIKVKPTPVPAATVVAQALEGCAALIKQSNIDIDTEATENELAEVELLVDPALINQVVTNLIRNAIEAMDGKGRLEIQLGCALRARDESPPIRVESHQWNAARSDGMAASLKTAKDAAADDEASMVSCPIDRELPKRAPMGRANERFISLSIIDSGPGIEPEVLERVFNPFFTTRAHGTGLGLAIAHRIADAHHAVIELSNRPQQGGLDATLHLPIADPGIMLRVAPGSDATETKSLPGSSSKRNSKASLDAGTPVRRRATKKSTPRRTASSRAGKKSAGMSAVDATGI
ncbi:MAG: sensor histidine kinase, partial [Planctomycetota bacterium]